MCCSALHCQLTSKVFDAELFDIGIWHLHERLTRRDGIVG